MKLGRSGSPVQENIVDYVRGERRSFGERSLCDADLLAFAALAHLELETVHELAELMPLRLETLAALPQVRRLSEKGLVGPLAFELLELAAQSRRFADIAVAACESKCDQDAILQFGAVAFLVRDVHQQIVVAFRGTGSELVGWHEDFNLAVMKEIPAQREALRFLERVAAMYPDARIVCCGHSKGGALAEYAALFSDPAVFRRIEMCVAFDSPGLFKLGSQACKEFISTDAALLERYHSAHFPLVRYVFPSFVGLALEPRPLELMRYCTGATSKPLHGIDSVVVRGGDLVLRVPSTQELLRATALNRWVEQLSLADRQCFIDSVFAECYSTGAQLDVSRLADWRTWAWYCSMHVARSGADTRKQLGRIMGLAAREFGRK